MRVDLRTIFPLKPGALDALDSFIEVCMTHASAWQSSRTSDGIEWIRVVEREAERLRICGRLFEIDQTEHSFWLDLEHRGDAAAISWALYVDVIASSPRKARNALDNYDDAELIEWRVSLGGLAEVQAGVLVPTSIDHTSIQSDSD